MPADPPAGANPPIETISALTLAVTDMERSLGFYRSLGFELRYGGVDQAFSSFALGDGYLNLTCEAGPEPCWWGRVIFYVADVDATYARALEAGWSPQMAPRDASWGERYFHLRDPDGHELSFARPIPGRRV